MISLMIVHQSNKTMRANTQAAALKHTHTHIHCLTNLRESLPAEGFDKSGRVNRPENIPHICHLQIGKM